eukprot:7989700-Heterocapsa_arctica.AAC.1
MAALISRYGLCTVYQLTCATFSPSSPAPPSHCVSRTAKLSGIDVQKHSGTAHLYLKLRPSLRIA